MRSGRDPLIFRLRDGLRWWRPGFAQLECFQIDWRQILVCKRAASSGVLRSAARAISRTNRTLPIFPTGCSFDLARAFFHTELAVAQNNRSMLSRALTLDHIAMLARHAGLKNNPPLAPARDSHSLE
jgi:hypothetical protein